MSALIVFVLKSIPILIISFPLLLKIAVHIRRLLSPIYRIPGPEPADHLLGNLHEFYDQNAGEASVYWTRKYGEVLKIESHVGRTRLMISDPKALQHVLVTNAYNYPKPFLLHRDLGILFGKGLFYVEGQEHKRQRKSILPAFSPAHIKGFTPMIWEKAYKLRDKLTEIIESGKDDDTHVAECNVLPEAKREKGVVVVDMLNWVNRLCLDVIGITGFGYEFDALDSKTSPLGSAFAKVLEHSIPHDITPHSAIHHFIFFTFSWISNFFKDKEMELIKNCHDVMFQEAKKIVDERVGEIVEGKGGKDLVSLLLKAALNEDPSQRLSEEELMAQISFMVGGHETIASALIWCIDILTSNPSIQQTLRTEILTSLPSISETDPETLHKLPYLDAFTREVLRFRPSVPSTLRCADEDDAIPVTKPIELTPPAKGIWGLFGGGQPRGVVGKDGKETVDRVFVKKGQHVTIAIQAYNRSKEIWGEDADEFKPERWMKEGGGGEEGKTTGMYAGLMTFLSGPRSCIGYRFALIEWKIFLVVLLSEFEFVPRNAKTEIDRRAPHVTYPWIRGEHEKGARLPVGLRKIEF